MRIHAALKSFRGSGSVKETGCDAQCANLVAGGACHTDFIHLADPYHRLRGERIQIADLAEHGRKLEPPFIFCRGILQKDAHPNVGEPCCAYPSRWGLGYARNVGALAAGPGRPTLFSTCCAFANSSVE